MTQTIVQADPTPAATTGKSLRERAKALAPRIAERAQAVEEMRHVHEDSIAEMVDAGLTRGLQSRRYGGEEGTLEDFIGAVIEISKACTSTGWVLCILGAHNWEMAHMSPELQDELYGDDPTTLLSSSYAPQGNTAQRVDGGFRLSGKWKSSSGVHHARSVVLGADVPGEATHNFVVPLTDATVIDDWYTLGLAGTGSRSVVLEDVFVPEHRTLDREILQAQAGPGLRLNTGATFRVPQALLYSSVAGGPALGAGWRFYEEFPNYLGMPASRAGQWILDNALALSKYTEARGALNAQEILTLHWHREAFEYASRGEQMPVLRIAEAMYGIACGARAAVQVASTLMPMLRPSSVYSTSIVQRLYRDILVTRQHGTQNADRAADFMGKVQQGVPAGHAFLMQPEKLRAARERAAARGWL
jgi:3-hydroxy-9,10-secoandrosta-1,3,5(10)-triene-9,17-dione monooxygenase